MSKSSTHDVIFYVQLEPEYGRYIDPSTGERSISGVKAVALTQKRPNRPKPGTISVKMQVRAPEAFFLPLRPAAIVVLPEDLSVLSTPVQVDAVDDLEEPTS
jgi:hypothetical protein